MSDVEKMAKAIVGRVRAEIPDSHPPKFKLTDREAENYVREALSALGDQWGAAIEAAKKAVCPYCHAGEPIHPEREGSHKIDRYGISTWHECKASMLSALRRPTEGEG